MIYVIPQILGHYIAALRLTSPQARDMKKSELKSDDSYYIKMPSITMQNNPSIIIANKKEGDSPPRESDCWGEALPSIPSSRTWL